MVGMLDDWFGMSGSGGLLGDFSTNLSNKLNDPLMMLGLNMMMAKPGKQDEAMANGLKMAMLAKQNQSDAEATGALKELFTSAAKPNPITGSPLPSPGAARMPESPAFQSAIGYGKPDPEGVTGDYLRAANAGRARDQDVVTRTAYGESNTPEGQQAVANVIMNRSRQSGMTPGQVAMSPGQFEPWMREDAQKRMAALSGPAYDRVKSSVAPVFSGVGQDNTGGADHFYAPTAQAALGRDTPKWAQGQQPTASVGGNQFYALGYGGKGSNEADLPAKGSQVAQGFAIPGQANDADPMAGIPENVRRQIPRLLANEKTRGVTLEYLKGRGIFNPEEKELKRRELEREPMVRQQLELGNKKSELEISGDMPTEAGRNYKTYRQQEIAEGRQPKSQLEYQRELRTTINTGPGPSGKVFEAMEKSAESAKAAAEALPGFTNAKNAVAGGGIFGFGADGRLGLAKVAAYFGADPNSVVNTETFRSAVAPVVLSMIKGTGANPSNADREFVEKAAGGQISLDEGSIKRLIDIGERAAKAKIAYHNKIVDQVYPDSDDQNRQVRSLFRIDAEGFMSAVSPDIQKGAAKKDDDGGWKEIAPGVRIREKR